MTDRVMRPLLIEYTKHERERSETTIVGLMRIHRNRVFGGKRVEDSAAAAWHVQWKPLCLL
jgi:hypothetical protein